MNTMNEYMDNLENELMWTDMSCLDDNFDFMANQLFAEDWLF